MAFWILKGFLTVAILPHTVQVIVRIDRVQMPILPRVAPVTTAVAVVPTAIVAVVSTTIVPVVATPVVPTTIVPAVAASDPALAAGTVIGQFEVLVGGSPGTKGLPIPASTRFSGKTPLVSS